MRTLMARPLFVLLLIVAFFTTAGVCYAQNKADTVSTADAVFTSIPTAADSIAAAKKKQDSIAAAKKSRIVLLQQQRQNQNLPET